MMVEREIAGFAIPFVVSTAATVFAGASSGNIFITFLILSGTAVPWILLTLPVRRKWSQNSIRILIALTAIGTGGLCGLRANEMSISETQGHIITSIALRYGEKLKDTADSIPFRDERTNAFVKAVLTGERDGMTKEVTEAFRDSGASHILALSGLHLGVIYMLICRLLSISGHSIISLRMKSILTVFVCGFYSLATGASPSITRAFIFIVINETARLTGRFTSTGNTLMASLILHLCLVPSAISTAGFQLSYAAMAGIAFIFPVLKGFWPDNDKGYVITYPARWIWNSTAMSISCQITTGPIAYLYFGTFPKYFLLTNLIALPLTGILIPTAALTLLLYQAEICPDLMIRSTEWLTGILIGALEIISSM